ncbi:hypothetical protein OESDEN_19649 [Oesophagostomum dentatum]|uniref:Uncharacterized protein n=1 Tax=Oesophagostomum dentatum TaxID=61180 RepID=A0A0B1S5S8_OESDE|nr:hypothetical protein OESDEN_19649 [Oesophagostomum dentatum]
MNVRVMDALDYLQEAAEKADQEKLDMINMKNALNVNGVLALNLVTRDEEVANGARRSVSAHFPALFHICSDEDVNEVGSNYNSLQESIFDAVI